MERKTVKLITLLAIFIVCFCALTGCAKCISKTEETVKVKIVNEYYKPEERHISIISGRPHIYTDYADYEITVDYNGIEYSFTDEDTYRRYHGRIGEEVQAILVTKTYDNGKVKQYITKLGGKQNEIL